MIKVVGPSNGPQLIKMLVGLTLLVATILGVAVITDGQGAEPELELELELELAEAPHVGPEMVFASSVMVAAARPIHRPFKVALVFMALVPLRAKTFPLNAVVVSSVAELPTLHHKLQASPPVMDEPGDVISVDTVLKIWTPEPVRFRFPVNEKLLVEQ